MAFNLLLSFKMYIYIHNPLPNTGLVSVPFPPLLTGVWVEIIVLFKWAAIVETPGQFYHGGEVPNSVIKYFIYLEYDKFLMKKKIFFLLC